MTQTEIAARVRKLAERMVPCPYLEFVYDGVRLHDLPDAAGCISCHGSGQAPEFPALRVLPATDNLVGRLEECLDAVGREWWYHYDSTCGVSRGIERNDELRHSYYIVLKVGYRIYNASVRIEALLSALERQAT